MLKEHETSPTNGFELTENERLFDKVSNKRFRELIFDNRTTIHSIRVDSNSYGEFLFVTASQPKGQEREILTFWGLGFHDFRERWLTEDWSFHQSYPTKQTFKQHLTPDEAQQLIEERQKDIELDMKLEMPQSATGILFEMLADLTDEDGALSELQDLSYGLLWDDDYLDSD